MARNRSLGLWVFAIALRRAPRPWVLTMAGSLGVWPEATARGHGQSHGQVCGLGHILGFVVELMALAMGMAAAMATDKTMAMAADKTMTMTKSLATDKTVITAMAIAQPWLRPWPWMEAAARHCSQRFSQCLQALHTSIPGLAFILNS